MSVKEKTLKIKTDIIISKLEEYIKNQTKKLKQDPIVAILQKNDPKIKSHRLLLSKTEILELSILISQEKKKFKINTFKESITITLKESFTKTSVETTIENTRKLEVFNLSNSMIESMKLPRQAIEIKGISKSTTEVKQEFIKMRANSFVSQISDYSLNKNLIKNKNVGASENISYSHIETSRQKALNTNKPTKINTLTTNLKITEPNIKTKTPRLTSYTNVKETTPNASQEIKNILSSEIGNGVIWGIKINITAKKEVLKTMTKYSKNLVSQSITEEVISYPDLFLTIFFNKNQIVEKIEINSFFIGSTKEGLKVGDFYDKAIKLYGKPNIIDNKSLNWADLKVYFEWEKIISMIIYSNKINLIFDKNILTKDFVIYTQGMLLGIIISNSTKSIIVGGNNKNYVINFMKDFSNIKFPEENKLCLYYNDVDIKYYFADDETLTTIEFGQNFLGKTLNDLKVGDHIDVALKLYGKPLVSNPNFLSWHKMSVFYENNLIKIIKIQK